VRLASVFTDNMMLQRDKPICVWGWAAPGETVKVTLAKQEASATADADGKWAVKLPAMKEGENLELTVTGKNTIVLKNVIMGDIWLCAGPEMDGTLEGYFAPEDIKNADFPKVRRIKIKAVVSADPQDEAVVAKPWEVCMPKTAGAFTAVGFYFAREVIRNTGVPIGILDCSRRNVVVEPWVAPEGMEMIPELKNDNAQRLNCIAEYRAALPKAMENMKKWEDATRAALQSGAWVRPAPQIPENRATSLYGWCSLYNATIRPMARMPIKGALWAHSWNTSEGEVVNYRLRALIGGWRKAWGQGDFPFYFVQQGTMMETPGFDKNNPVGGDGWAPTRPAETRVWQTAPNSGMVVSIDSGGDLGTIGLRLSRWALSRDYGQKDLLVSGPLFKEMKVENGKLRLSFEYAGSGLMVGKKTGREPVSEDKDGKLKRIAIAGADKVWHWADAVIDGQTLVLSSPDVREPAAVRYAYSQNTEGANLYNKEGLPAVPFRTDDWDLKK
jgi:sialate O-acetylesterase